MPCYFLLGMKYTSAPVTRPVKTTVRASSTDIDGVTPTVSKMSNAAATAGATRAFAKYIYQHYTMRYEPTPIIIKPLTDAPPPAAVWSTTNLGSFVVPLCSAILICAKQRTVGAEFEVSLLYSRLS